MTIIIETKGTPQERGFQQGQQLKKEINEGIRAIFYSDFFKEIAPKGIPLSLL
jgi:hypothetical protein